MKVVLVLIIRTFVTRAVSANILNLVMSDLAGAVLLSADGEVAGSVQQVLPR